MSASHRLIALGFIVLLGFCARAATYKVPLLDHHAWRQADTAAIARNFYRERFNILYPQVDHRGAQERGYVATGLEVLAFIVAGISLATGFHYEIGRLASSVLFVGSCLLVETFARRRYGPEHGLVAAFLYAFGFPLLVFIERAFMNESLLIFLSLACLVATARYLERPRVLTLATLIAASTAVATIKLPYLIVWAPVVGLFLERYGVASLKRWELWTMAVVNVVAAVVWYSHVSELAASTGLSFGLTDKLFDTATVFSAEFPMRLLVRFRKDILGPVLFVAVTIGLWRAVLERRWFEPLGVAGYLAYLVLVALGNFHHDYYQLALMPVAPFLASSGLIYIADQFGSARRRDQRLALFLGLAVVSTFVRHVSAHSWYEYSPGDVAVCEALARLSAPADRIAFAGYNDPKIMFCADRKGWLLAESDGVRLDEAMQRGARLAVLSRAVVDQSVYTMVRSRAGEPAFTTSEFDVFVLR